MADSDVPQIFISYSWQDGRPTMEQLCARLPSILPGCRVWRDDRINPAAPVFTLEIQRAIERSAAALFVMTAASRESQWCEREIFIAQDQGVPYAVIRPHPQVRLPFSLGGSTWIINLPDGDHAGWQRLGRFLRGLGSPTARRAALEDEQQRLIAGAARAVASDRRRFAARERELAASISTEQTRIADPAGAERRMRERIERDLATERVPASDAPVARHGVRYVNEIPGMPPARFHDRSDELERLKMLLAGSEARLIALTGRDGMGKTALMARLREAVGHDVLADYDAFVLLNAYGDRQVTVATLLRDIAKVLDEPLATTVRERLDESVPCLDKLATLLEALAGTGVVVVIDGAEDLLDERGEFRDPDLREVCHEIAILENHGVRMLFVTQRYPDPLFREVGRRAARAPLDDGLPLPDAGEFLRMLDRDGILGPVAADTEFMSRLHAVTGGHPRSLELFYGILRAEPYTATTFLLRDAEGLPRGTDVAGALFLRMLNGLHEVERRVVQALAVYDRPVLPGAVDFLLADTMGAVEAAEPLRQLEARRMVRRDGNRYHLPRRDAAQALSRMEPGVPADRGARPMPYTLTALRSRAAEFYRQSQVPRALVRQVADLSNDFGEIEMRVLGGEYEVALQLIGDRDEAYLRRWGHSGLLLPWRDDLVPHLGHHGDHIQNLSMAAAARSQQERYDKAIADLRLALRRARRAGVIRKHIDLWRQLGAVEQRRGALTRANRLFRRALLGCRVLRIRSEEARVRLNLGLGLAKVGRFEAAVRHVQAGIDIGDRHWVDDEITIKLWLNLGWIYGQRNRVPEALEANERARAIAENKQYDLLSGLCARGRAEILVNGDRPRSALPLATQAHQIGVRARNAALLCEASTTIALANLRVDDVPAAADAARVGMLHRSSQHAVELLLLQGIVAFRFPGRRSEARVAFNEACRKAAKHAELDRRNYQAHDLHGLVLAGLALCGDDSCVVPALEAFARARAITDAHGAVRRNQLLLDQFGDGADPDALAKLRKAAGR